MASREKQKLNFIFNSKKRRNKMTDVFKGRARMIFALLGGIAFLVVQAVFPDLPFTEAQSLLFMGLIGAYILGEGIGGAVIGDNLKTLLASQKFQALIVGLIVSSIKLFAPDLAIGDTELMAVVGTLMAFILGSGIQKANNF
jgi:hypothetical protein